MTQDPLAGADVIGCLLSRAVANLERDDRVLCDLLAREQLRQSDVLSMIASSSVADPSVLACQGMAVGNVTTEGYAGARFHGGCDIVDEVEKIAIARACQAFGAKYANVQPHSGSTANQIVFFSVLKPGDTLLGLNVKSGGHLTHGSKASVSGRYFNAVTYGVDALGRLDYAAIRNVAIKCNPKLIIAGASAYPRTIDFGAFRRIADEVGAYLLADISHIAGLVAAGEHPSPIDFAHFTTTSTYKQIGGPRGGLILIGREHESLGPDGRHSLAQTIQEGVFPLVQGTPNLSAIAAKARALAIVCSPTFAELARRIVADAAALAQALSRRGWTMVTGGTDNHMIVIDCSRRGLTGFVAERALEECGIVVNRNVIPGDTKPPETASGFRIGTNILASRCFRPADMEECAALIDRVLANLAMEDDRHYRLDIAIREQVRSHVATLCRRHPILSYAASRPRPRAGIDSQSSYAGPS